MARQQSLDALIIGGGHNGLVCAAYLAGAGRRVTVLEARGIVGGAAVTEEFHPGFRNSSCSYTVSLLNPRVISDLRLEAHGLRVVERPFANFLPLADGDAFRFGGEWTAREVARFSRATRSGCRLVRDAGADRGGAAGAGHRDAAQRLGPLRAGRLAGVAGPWRAS
jgi:phytoene dehydrogenase-like protein